MGLIRDIVRSRRGIEPPMGRPRMVPNIPEPIPPLDPFERLPFDDPRNDFMSIQRVEDVGVPGITPVEPVMPPPIPLPIPPVLPQPIMQQPIIGEVNPENALPPVVGGPALPPVTPSVIPPQPSSISGIGDINQDLKPLEKPIIPPRRDDFMSINRVNSDDLRQRQALGLTAVPGVGSNNFGGTPLVKGPVAPQEQTGLTAAELLELSDEELRKYIPRKSIGNMYTSYDATPSPEEFREQLQRELNPDPNDPRAFISSPMRYKLLYENPIVGRRPPRSRGPALIANPAPTPDPVIEPAPTTPAAVATDVGAVPTTTIPQDVRGQIDPVLAQQDAREVLSDPLLRALYFGTADQPGFINQLQQATQNVMGAELPSTQFDPNMTQQFFNPFEDRVVQQTIQDVMDFGEKQDVAARARDIQTGGLSAFGSRARLTADERREALGRGLAESLSGIRQSGFSEAQRTALGQFGDQYARQMGQINRPIDLLTTVGRSLPGYGAQQTVIDSKYRLPVDPTAAGLGAAFSTYQAIKPPAQTPGG